ncbi:MAG TPA: 2-oxoglutarate dehydrogenase E1 component [Candidatus Acidoferrales bacterium]
MAKAKTAAPAREKVLDAFRRWGYLQADLDPLGFLRPEAHPDLELTGKDADQARRWWCGTIGVEYWHIPDPARRRWIEERVEAEASPVDQKYVLERLARAELFEQVLQSRYLGTKRFSMEGVSSLLPLMDALLEEIAGRGADEAVVAMSHRGRLNLMVHVVNRAVSDIVARFEDVDPRSVLGSGDVKYHMGATGEYNTRTGGKVRIHMVSNPSHLEAVDPVALGRTRAKHTRRGENGPREVVPVVIHGDAAFAGQGIWAETLVLTGIRGFTVGGAIHIIANNLIGFTARPEECHSSRFASDLAKRVPVPIFHVNAEDPDAAVRVGRLAAEYRYEFESDVVVDLIGYRRHGHSEVDDPTITSPLLYRKIKGFPVTYQNYAQRSALPADEIVAAVKEELNQEMDRAAELEEAPVLRTLPGYWDAFTGGPYKHEYEVETAVGPEQIAELTKALTTWPDSFRIHPKVKKLLEQRARMGGGQSPVDYGMAEALAFASLVRTGVPVRLSGQDSRRGTFNQRHAVLVDTETEEDYIPLDHVHAEQAGIEIYSSMLSEAAVMGFEYGYSRDYPETLVLWEAQFGDFANSAQIIIDQFLAAGEDKWKLLSGLVLLLPHGYEGQGPEHSSARIERFLQLAAEDNLQVCQPSTASQYFHLLRRQALRKWRKPLVVFTPKSMLRHPEAASPIEEFSDGRFFNVLPDRETERATRVLICTGKVGHDLRRERKARKDESTAIVSIEQLYPFPEDELGIEMGRHWEAREFVWVQEEPANMGALFYVMPLLERIAGARPVRSVKRSASASPATGSAGAHELEQKTLLTLAFAARHA